MSDCATDGEEVKGRSNSCDFSPIADHATHSANMRVCAMCGLVSDLAFMVAADPATKQLRLERGGCTGANRS